MSERIHVRDLRTCPDKNDLPTSLADELAYLLRKDTTKVIPDGKSEDSEFYKVTAPKGLELNVQVNSGGDLHDRHALSHIARIGDNYLQNESLKDGVRVQTQFGISEHKYTDRVTHLPQFTEAKFDPHTGKLVSESGWIMTKNYYVGKRFEAKFDEREHLRDYRIASGNENLAKGLFKPAQCLDK